LTRGSAETKQDDRTSRAGRERHLCSLTKQSCCRPQKAGDSVARRRCGVWIPAPSLRAVKLRGNDTKIAPLGGPNCCRYGLASPTPAGHGGRAGLREAASQITLTESIPLTTRGGGKQQNPRPRRPTPPVSRTAEGRYCRPTAPPRRSCLQYRVYRREALQARLLLRAPQRALAHGTQSRPHERFRLPMP
jgi:hypothetical protein